MGQVPTIECACGNSVECRYMWNSCVECGRAYSHTGVFHPELGGNLRLDRDDFRAWVEGHGADEEVGERGSSCHCPIANYLKSQIDNLESLQVGNVLLYSTKYLPCEIMVKLPAWVQEFIQKIDEPVYKHTDPIRVSMNVTVDEALEVLDDIG